MCTDESSPSTSATSMPSASTGTLRGSEHNYSTTHSRRKLKQGVHVLHDTLDSTKKLTALNEQNLVSDSCAGVLDKCSSGSSLQLVPVLWQLRKHKAVDFSDKHYLADLRAFVLTLNFYSSKAYDFVRETFRLCLLHLKISPNGIGLWMVVHWCRLLTAGIAGS